MQIASVLAYIFNKVYVSSVYMRVHILVFPPFTASHKVLLNACTSVPRETRLSSCTQMRGDSVKTFFPPQTACETRPGMNKKNVSEYKLLKMLAYMFEAVYIY